MTTETSDGIASAVAEAGVATRAYPHGGVIFVKDDPADCAYVIVSGRVEIRETGRVLESIGPNEIFGEVGMIDGGSRSASAVAVGATEVRVIDRSTFDRLLRESPDFVMAIMRDMARRLRVMNANQRPATGLPLVPSRLEKRTAG
ncbi:Crp/Fnr family transcriptional regulator [Bauldia litoralis]|uniref:Cyclic nucleotide-binding domain-containing protein n=1 Tax=Bauldia litoralis TaxID=665467 RepID=A0A1G6C4U3_9HYPH|nr:Crp/Fnr family transcriptional regulator [Bauldia litoralis]SDB27890.1 Cyclic nucleotide-binding domain-containing protein [Bauldia litoralis]